MKFQTILASVVVGLPFFLSAHCPTHLLQDAYKLAAEQKKDVLIVFSRSSWSNQSKKFDTEILNAEAFKKGAGELFARVTFDFPKEREKTDRELLELQMKYMVRQMPSVLLVDPGGRPFGYSGMRQGGPEEFLTHLRELVEVRKKRDVLFAKAKTLKGLERAKVLVEALELLPSQVVRTFYVPEMADIAKSDREGVTGYIAKVEKEEALKKEQAYYQALFREKQFEKIISDSIKAAQAAKGEDSQRLSLYKIQALATLERFEEADKAIDAMASVVPESELAKRAPQYHQAVARMKARSDRLKEAKTAQKNGTAVPRKRGPIVSKPVAIVNDINVLKKEAVDLAKQALKAAEKEQALAKETEERKKKIASMESELVALKEAADSAGPILEKASEERRRLATKAKAMKEVIASHEAMEARRKQVSELEKKAKNLQRESKELQKKAPNTKPNE